MLTANHCSTSHNTQTNSASLKDKHKGISVAQRDKLIAAMFRDGKTLREIGDEFDISRERVRQIIKAWGIKKSEGGNAVAKDKRKQAKLTLVEQKKQDRVVRLEKVFGCSIETATEINRGLPVRVVRDKSPTGRFLNIRTQVERSGAKWKLTLPEWAGEWQKAGQWDGDNNQCGKGYAMIRIDNTKPFEKDNVVVVRKGVWLAGSRKNKKAA